MASHIRALSSIISSAAFRIETVYNEHGLEQPTLDLPYQPTLVDHSSDMIEARQLLIAAATQIIAVVSLPGDYLKESITGMFLTALLGVATDAGLADSIAEAGDTNASPRPCHHACSHHNFYRGFMLKH